MIYPLFEPCKGLAVSNLFRIFAELKSLHAMDWRKFIDKIPRWLLNKYVITCVFFAVILVCCGEQSLCERSKRARRIRVLEQELDSYNARIERYRKDMEELRNSQENIERFAREHYYMHADNEDVYLIEEE